MAPVPGLGGAGLTEPQRKALRQKIAEKKAAQVKSELETRAAKDKANVQAGLGGGAKPRRKKGPEYPATKVKAGGRTVHTKTRVPTTVVQGAPDSERQRKRAAQRPSRAVAPQLERPKNPNYKPKPKNDQGPPEQRPKKRQLDMVTPNPKLKGKPIDNVPEHLKQEHKDAQPAKGKAPAKPGKSAKSSPGPGPTGTGGGRDADGGKDRTNFEDERRKTNTGGKDRPAVYKPQDDGNRGGYIGRSKKVIPAPGGGIPARKKKTNTGGTSVVKGLTPRF